MQNIYTSTVKTFIKDNYQRLRVVPLRKYKPRGKNDRAQSWGEKCAPCFQDFARPFLAVFFFFRVIHDGLSLTVPKSLWQTSSDTIIEGVSSGTSGTVPSLSHWCSRSSVTVILWAGSTRNKLHKKEKRSLWWNIPFNPNSKNWFHLFVCLIPLSYLYMEKKDAAKL